MKSESEREREWRWFVMTQTKIGKYCRFRNHYLSHRISLTIRRVHKSPARHFMCMCNGLLALKHSALGNSILFLFLFAPSHVLDWNSMKQIATKKIVRFISEFKVLQFVLMDSAIDSVDIFISSECESDRNAAAARVSCDSWIDKDWYFMNWLDMVGLGMPPQNVPHAQHAN